MCCNCVLYFNDKQNLLKLELINILKKIKSVQTLYPSKQIWILFVFFFPFSLLMTMRGDWFEISGVIVIYVYLLDIKIRVHLISSNRVINF